MISSKLIPSFYMLEISGDAIESIFPGDYGIDKVLIESSDFESDMETKVALDNAIDFLSSAPHINMYNIEDVTKFNPDFYPSVPRETPSDEQMTSYNQLLEEAEIQSMNGKESLVVTKFFDVYGDFIQCRREVKSQDFQIVGRTASDPDIYLKEIREQHLSKLDNPNKKDQHQQFH